jgi:predicted AAA+ superfamily ATPase
MVMLAHQHGNLLNSSELGRSLGLSYHTINDYLDVLEGHYLLRRLPPYHFNSKKRVVKSSKIYIRDTGILHYLLGIANERNFLESPKRGNSFQGLVIEQIVSLEKLNHIGTQCYFCRTHAGAEIDLLLDRGNERIGIEIKCSASVTPRDWTNLKDAIDQKIIDRGYLVNLAQRNYDVAETIRVISTERLLSPSVSGFDGMLLK